MTTVATHRAQALLDSSLHLFASENPILELAVQMERVHLERERIIAYDRFQLARQQVEAGRCKAHVLAAEARRLRDLGVDPSTAMPESRRAA